MIEDLFGQVDYLNSGLNAAWTRNSVLANNIANVDTENYKRLDLKFNSILETEKSKESNGNKELKYSIEEDSDSEAKMNGNNVDIEYESSELAKNTIWYNYMVQKVSSEFRKIEMAINESK